MIGGGSTWPGGPGGPGECEQLIGSRLIYERGDGWCLGVGKMCPTACSKDQLFYGKPQESFLREKKRKDRSGSGGGHKISREG